MIRKHLRNGSGGLGQFDGVVEGGLYGGLVGGNLCGPGDGDAGEGFGDEEAVPGVGLPCAVRVDVEGPNGATDKFGQLDDSGFSHLSRAARAVGGDGAVVASQVGTLQVAQASGAVARTRAADGDEAEPLDGAGDQFSVEAAADEDGDAMVAESPCRGEQAAMPEGVDSGWRRIVAGKSIGIADVLVAQRDAKAADDGARKARNDSEGDALLQRVRRIHEDEFTFPILSRMQKADNKSLRRNI